MSFFVLWMFVASMVNSGSFCLNGLSYTDDQNGPNYTFLHEATSAPAISYYHYIIIGGGAAGCPLAATLSSKYNVLLIERGGSPYGNPNITNLSSFRNITLADLSSTSLSQRFISEDGVINSRARVLGGGTSVNAGFYSRAEPKYVKDSSWDDKLVNESYEWVEKLVVCKPKVEAWQSAVRDGLLEVGVLPNNGFTFDHVNGTKIGGTMFDQNGHRHTAADLLRYANPKRLTVLLHATVSRALFSSKGKQKPVAYGVIFTDKSGMKHKAYLKQEGLGFMKNEIILSSGALGSPQLLMLSGVGPADHLRSLNITVVVDQPLVGQGMSDNPMNGIFVPSPTEVEVSLVQVVGITEFGNYIEAASGGNSTVFNGGIIFEKVIGPLSTGHLELKTKNPNANPLVTFNYFKEPRDLQRCVNGVKTIEKVIASKAFSKFRFDSISFQTLLNLTSSFPINLVPKTGNDSTSLEQFCKNTVTTLWH
ncbi:protein HOTHEAD-like [Papaver somniferum]|uniref:protein HOTHEAD-like n=1 Tax=Papaver somniferum TaxID=3469 RepID=UPI000E6F949D|nr:protein HOTHEAD-like [Papaver somniferum]